MLKGFTLVEIIVTIGIFAVIATLTSVSFFSSYSRSNLNAASSVLAADIKTAQSQAMAGQGQSGASLTGWGVMVNSSTSYTIFPGTTYDAGNSGNIVTNLASSLSLSTNFPSSSVTFAQGTGEILGYVTGSDTFTLTDGTSTKTIQLNQYGTIIGE